VNLPPEVEAGKAITFIVQVEGLDGEDLDFDWFLDGQPLAGMGHKSPKGGDTKVTWTPTLPAGISATLSNLEVRVRRVPGAKAQAGGRGKSSVSAEQASAPAPAPAAPSPPLATARVQTLIGDNDSVVTARRGRVASSPIAKGLADMGGLPVTLTRAHVASTPREEALWVRILAGGNALGFDEYRQHVNAQFCAAGGEELRGSGVASYDRLKDVSVAFMTSRCVQKGIEPHITDAYAEARRRMQRTVTRQPVEELQNVEAARARLGEIPEDFLIQCIDPPERWKDLCLLELIWSYWHEEGMLVQTMKAISRRFQNRKGTVGKDPLANFELDPLRRLNNFLWGYVEDEQHRLSVLRRAHEYEHHYGFPLWGKAVADLNPADRRSKFVESFHNLLARCVQFYRQDDDHTVAADGFPVLNAVKETHFVLNQGSHNQFGDLPEVARREMLLEQWLLARPETGEFLRARYMVPYPESWMDRVDAMKNLQGWTDASSVHFRDLAEFGEKIVLTLRYGSWATAIDPAVASNWARFWRPEIQSYIHAYRAVAGVDLARETTSERQDEDRYAAPSVLLRRRLAEQTAQVGR
jgi:hypothetical protein